MFLNIYQAVLNICQLFQLFLNCLCNLQNNQILCEIDCVKLFCNIPEIYAANRNFWHNYILPVLMVRYIHSYILAVFMVRYTTTIFSLYCTHGERYIDNHMFPVLMVRYTTTISSLYCTHSERYIDNYIFPVLMVRYTKTTSPLYTW
jgi:hypothetical protein